MPHLIDYIVEVEWHHLDFSFFRESPNVPRGVHAFVRQLAADIRTFIDLHNKNPKPLSTKSADQILACVKRFCHKLSKHYVANFRFA
ncbi:hypothetical protein XH88_21910 [Bradyrhizobium sp. CCBAU 51627]|nr:hypothetical protein [Bradyrhizobium sp. CCBAU 51627]